MQKNHFMSKTQNHIDRVEELLFFFVQRLEHRAASHDQSKLFDPEQSLFAQYEDQLADVTYDSEEYWELMEKLKPAIEHHYEENRHHPNFHENGIEDMNLIDVVEMFFDWWAASERHNDGDIKESIEKNKERFDLSDQLAKIFHNTVDQFSDRWG